MRILKHRFSKILDHEIRGQKARIWRASVFAGLQAVSMVLLAFWFWRNAQTMTWKPETFALVVVGVMLAGNSVFFIRYVLNHIRKMPLKEYWDTATGVWNGSYFYERLQEEVVRAARYHHPVTVGFLFLDHWQSTLELYGRPQSENMLRQFVALIQGSIRDSDVFAREQEEAFSLLFPHTDLVHAERVINRLQEQCAKEMDCHFIAGITAFRPGENTAQFHMRAKTALEQAKRSGAKTIQCLVGDGEHAAALEF